MERPGAWLGWLGFEGQGLWERSAPPPFSAPLSNIAFFRLSEHLIEKGWKHID